MSKVYRYIHVVILIVFFLSVETVYGQEPHVFSGSWVTATEEIGFRPSPLLRREFKLNGKVRSAKLYVCGVGFHISKINGRAVSTSVLEQAFTKYNSRLLYSSYDVGRLLKTGQNCIGVELGNGWFNLHSKTIWNYDKVGWRRSPRLLLDLEVEYIDGRKEVISSDDSWKWGTGGSRFNSLPAGEIYDARKEVVGWDRAGFNDDSWKKVLLTSSPGGKLEPQVMPPVRALRFIKPVSFRKLDVNTYLYDMGQNFAGVVRLKVKGKAGDSVTIRYSERLKADGSLDAKYNAGHMIGPESDPKFATDIYILRGGGAETYTPRFTYHGFRYVQVEVPREVELSLSSVQGLFYSTDFGVVGSFKSSSKMLNDLNAAALQSYRSNYVGIPTDCPQREKMGWLADSHVICELGLWNFASASGYRKYLGDIRDVQLADGKLAGIAPTEGIGYSWIDPQDRDFGPGWGSALPLITWQMYLFSGDEGVVKENYEASKRYVDFLLEKAEATGYIYRTGLDDFLALEKTPKAVTSTIFLYQDLCVQSKMARVLKNTEDEVKYSELAERVKYAFNQEFFDGSVGSYRVKTLTALAGILLNGLCLETTTAQLASELALGVRSRDFKPDFGVFGTKWVLSALSDNGYADEAFRLLTNPKAGWGRWMTDGHTTLLEGWEPKDESLNHVFFGDYGAWYYRSLAGIKLDEQKPGFSRLVIAPVFPKGLDWMNTSHVSPFGQIKVKWKRVKALVELYVTVPNGVDAQLGLKGYERPLAAGTHKIWIR